MRCQQRYPEVQSCAVTRVIVRMYAFANRLRTCRLNGQLTIVPPGT